MKFLVYGGVVLLIVPFQMVVVHRFSIEGIVPDAVLVTVCLVGLWRGEFEAVVLGLVLGFLQDLLSGATVYLNLMTKPLIGLVSGIVGRTPIFLVRWMIPILITGLSLVSGLLILFLLQVSFPEMDVVQALLSIVMPQALYDGVLGAIVLFAVFRLFPTSHRRVWNP